MHHTLRFFLYRIGHRRQKYLSSITPPMASYKYAKASSSPFYHDVIKDAVKYSLIFHHLLGLAGEMRPFGILITIDKQCQLK